MPILTTPGFVPVESTIDETERFLDTEYPYHVRTHYKFKFDNGYGASVVQHMYYLEPDEKLGLSYGAEAGLWELAVFDDKGLNYLTEITSDVIGWQTDEEITELLERISKLDKANERREEEDGY